MATKRADGRYQASFRQNGKKRIVYGATEQEAEFKKRMAQAEGLATGPTPSTDLSLHDLAGLLWFPEILATGRPNTIRRYEVAYVNHIRPKWGNRLITSIKPAEVQLWLTEKARSGVSASGAQMYKSILSSILTRCVREGLILNNPAQYAKTPRRPDRERTASLSVIRTLMERVDGTNLAGPVFMAAVLGMRRGEICALKWSHIEGLKVSISEQRVVLQGEKRGKGIKTTGLKTDASKRSFILPKSLMDILERVGDMESAYVCTHRNRRPWNPEHLSEAWAGVRADLGFKDWHFHDLRHVAASTLASLGVDLLTIAAVLGHKSVDVTMLYAHAQEKTASEGFGRVSEALFPVEHRLDDSGLDIHK